MSIRVTNPTEQKQILNQVEDVLYFIVCELSLSNRIMDNVSITLDTARDRVLKYNDFTICNKMGQAIYITYGTNQTLEIELNKELHHYWIRYQQLINNIQKYLEKYETEKIKISMQKAYDTMLVDTFNMYMYNLNIQYRVSHTKNIDWKYVCETLPEIPVEMLKQLQKIVDWNIVAQYGNFDYNDLCDNDLCYEIPKYLFIVKNQKISAQLKKEIIVDYEYWERGIISNITKELIADRNSNGVAVDLDLAYCLENKINLDFDLLSKEYALPAELITKYLDKFSIDNMLKNDNIKCDILVIVSQKRQQNN
jgi:hypothetical protein